MEAYERLLACLRDPAAETTQRQDALYAFVKLVESRDGFPIRREGEVVFFYVAAEMYGDDVITGEAFDPDQRRAPIRVAGDFNDWDPEATPLQAEILNVHHARVAFVPREPRSRYKFVAVDASGQAVWFADPLARRFVFDAFGRMSLVHGGLDENGHEAGHLEWIRSVHSQNLQRARPIYLYLPPGYENRPQERYPVLYMHDGNNLFDPAVANANGSWEVDETADALIAAGLVEPFLVVGIPNNAYRMDEYTHVPDVIDGQTIGGEGRAYADFVALELKPIIDARYRTRPEREHTAVLGSSLGGLISFAIGYWHPDVFGKIGGMSSTFGWGRFGAQNDLLEDWYAAQDLVARGQVYYLDSGGGLVSGTSCNSPDADWSDNYCETVSFRDMLTAKGIDVFPDDPDAAVLTPDNINIYHWHEAGAPHNEAAWAQRLHRPLRLFFRPR